MNHRELCEMLKRMIHEERRITNEVLKMINRVIEKRSYLEIGYPSVFEFLTKECGYSNAAAYRRIEAAKLLRSLPEIEKKLESGSVNLSTLAKAQSVMKAQERATGERLDLDTKLSVIESIENKSTEEAERSLIELMPESKKHIYQERRTVIDEETTRCSMNFTKEMSEDIQKLKQIYSHKFPNASDAEIIAFALKALLTQTASAGACLRS